MADIIKYVEYYSNKTFDEVPFNDVDSLILTQLAYVDFEKSHIDKKQITLKELGKSYFENVSWNDMKNKVAIKRESYKLFEVVKDTKRYEDLLVCNYVDIIDSEKQFGAISFRRPNKWVYVSFEGTDSSVIGWKEDFDMSYEFPIPSQKMAIEFLKKEIRLFDRTIYIGGHSKGGNLAIVSAMEAPLGIKKRIKAIYNFDGPGLLEKEYNSQNYKKIKNKIKKFVPRESFIGRVLCSDEEYTVVESKARGIWQHDAFSWQCFGSYFIETQISKKSVNFAKEVDKFLENLTSEDREEFINAIFTIFEKAGITDIENITFRKLVSSTSFISELTTNKKIKEELKKMIMLFIKYFGL